MPHEVDLTNMGRGVILRSMLRSMVYVAVFLLSGCCALGDRGCPHDAFQIASIG